MSLRAVVLDMDDTLYDEYDYVVSGFAAVAGHLGLPEFAAVATRIFHDGERRQVFDHSLAHLGIAPDPGLVLECREVYRGHLPRISLSADAAWLLGSLSPECPVALLSDGCLAAQRRKFAALGVADRFAVVLFTDSLGRAHWKPSPIPFLKVSRALRLAAAECVYVGDNPTKDFIAPRELGWTTVRVRRPRGMHHGVAAAPGHDADQTVDSLHELADIGILDHVLDPLTATSATVSTS